MSFTSTFGSTATAPGTGTGFATNTSWSSRLSLGGNASGALISGSFDTRTISHVYSAFVSTRVAGNCTSAVTRISLNDTDISMTSGSRVFSSSSYSPSTTSPGSISVNTTIFNSSNTSRSGMYAGFVNLDISSRSNIGYNVGSGASDSPTAPSGAGIGSLNNVYRNGTSISTAGSIYGNITWATVPSAPSGFSSTTAPTSVTLSWTNAPSSDGSESINGWRVLYSVQGSGVWNTTGKISGSSSTTSLIVSGLSTSTAYYFRVSALNAVTDAINGSDYSSTAAIVGTTSGQISATTTSGLSGSFNNAYGTSTGDKLTGQLDFTNLTGSNVTVTIQSSATFPLASTTAIAYAGTTTAISWELTGLFPSSNYTVTAKVGSEIYATVARSTLAAGTISATYSSETWYSITVNVSYTNNLSTNQSIYIADTTDFGTGTTITAYANSTSSSTATVIDLDNNTAYTVRSKFVSYPSIYSDVTATTDPYPVTYSFVSGSIVPYGDKVTGQLQITNTANYSVAGTINLYNSSTFISEPLINFNVTPYQNSAINFTYTGLTPSTSYTIDVTDVDPFSDVVTTSTATLVAATLVNTYLSSTSSSITVFVTWVNNMGTTLTLEVDDTTGVGTLQSYSLASYSSGGQEATVPGLQPSTTYTIRARIPAIVSVNASGTTLALPARTWRIWNGTAWTTGSGVGVVKYWNGSTWVTVSRTRIWNGSSWE